MSGPRGARPGVHVTAQDIYEESENAQAAIGEKLRLGDRVFRYTKNGAVALAPGKMTQHPAPVANHQNESVAATVEVNAKVITVTLGGTLATTDQYAGGYIHINNDAGEGVTYRIKSNPSAGSTAALTLNLYDSVEKQITTAAEATLTIAKYNKVVVAINGGLTAGIAGVPLFDVTIDYYCWLQTKGPCAVLTQGSVIIGQKVTLGGTADGACGPLGDDVGVNWGQVLSVNASTDYSLIDLAID